LEVYSVRKPQVKEIIIMGMHTKYKVRVLNLETGWATARYTNSRPEATDLFKQWKIQHGSDPRCVIQFWVRDEELQTPLMVNEIKHSHEKFQPK
jgi:hypothetical protein